MTLGLLIGVFAGVLAWLIFSPAPRRGADRLVEDKEELESAEEQVRDLDSFTTPDDADDELTDWGPGAPQ